MESIRLGSLPGSVFVIYDPNDNKEVITILLTVVSRLNVIINLYFNCCFINGFSSLALAQMHEIIFLCQNLNGQYFGSNVNIIHNFGTPSHIGSLALQMQSGE